MQSTMKPPGGDAPVLTPRRRWARATAIGAAIVAASLVFTGVALPAQADTALTPIPVSGSARTIAYDSAHNRLYVTHTTASSSVVTPIDAATDTAGNTVAIGNVARDVVVDASRNRAYVVGDTSNGVTPIDTSNNTAGTLIGTGGSARRGSRSIPCTTRCMSRTMGRAT